MNFSSKCRSGHLAVFKRTFVNNQDYFFPFEAARTQRKTEFADLNTLNLEQALE